MTPVLRPITQLVIRWVYEGSFTDPSGDFFISSDSSIQYQDEQAWSAMFSLSNSLLPSTLSHHLAEDILLVGKSVNFIRNCCEEPHFTLIPSSSSSSSSSQPLQVSPFQLTNPHLSFLGNGPSCYGKNKLPSSIPPQREIRPHGASLGAETDFTVGSRGFCEVLDGWGGWGAGQKRLSHPPPFSLLHPRWCFEIWKFEVHARGCFGQNSGEIAPTFNRRCWLGYLPPRLLPHPSHLNHRHLPLHDHLSGHFHSSLEDQEGLFFFLIVLLCLLIVFFRLNGVSPLPGLSKWFLSTQDLHKPSPPLSQLSSTSVQSFALGWFTSAPTLSRI